MVYMMRKDFTSNPTALFFRDDGPELDLYVCPKCRKVEFYACGSTLPESDLKDTPEPNPYYVPGDAPVIACPRCKTSHPRNDEMCPLCGLARGYLDIETLPDTSANTSDAPEEPPESAQPEKKPLHFKKHWGSKDPWD